MHWTRRLQLAASLNRGFPSILAARMVSFCISGMDGDFLQERKNVQWIYLLYQIQTICSIIQYIYIYCIFIMYRYIDVYFSAHVNIYICIFPYLHTLVFIKHLKIFFPVHPTAHICIYKYPPGNYSNISHLEKRKIIFKMALKGDMLVPRRVNI